MVTTTEVSTVNPWVAARSSADVAGLAIDPKGLQAIDTKDIESIRKVAQQFESLFLNEMLKSMRKANEIFRQDNPLHSRESEFYQTWLDTQLSQEWSQQKGIGLADMLVKQLTQRDSKQPRVQQALSDQPITVSEKSHQALHTQQQTQTKASITTPLDSSIHDQLANKAWQSTPLLPSAPNSKAQSLQQQQANESATLDQPNDSSLLSRARAFVFKDQHDFLNKLYPMAQKAANELAISTELLLAQAALETGWGQHIIKDEQGQSGYNLFGIKAKENTEKADAIASTTKEYTNDQWVKIQDYFRRYPSLDDSFKDYVNLVKNTQRYQAVMQDVINVDQSLLQAADKQQQDRAYLTKLHQAGYATDPHYIDKVLAVKETVLSLIKP